MESKQEQGDALLGVAAIASELFGSLNELPKKERNKKIRQINHLLATGAVPGRKVGKFWCGSRHRLQQFLAGEGA